MLSPEIVYRGQPIALVAADTLEDAIEAASLIRASYEEEPFNVTIDAPDSDIVAQADSYLPKPAFADHVVGDADKAYAEAAVKVDVSFTCP